MPIISGSISEGAGIRGGVKTAYGKYSFASDGGAVGTIALNGSTDIPSGSTILGGWVEVTTAPTSGGAATIAITVNAADDLVAAAAISGAPWSTTGRKSIVPVFTGATSVRTTAARDISIVIATAALTAGVVSVTLLYVDPLT